MAESSENMSSADAGIDDEVDVQLSLGRIYDRNPIPITVVNHQTSLFDSLMPSDYVSLERVLKIILGVDVDSSQTTPTIANNNGDQINANNANQGFESQQYHQLAPKALENNATPNMLRNYFSDYPSASSNSKANISPYYEPTINKAPEIVELSSTPQLPMAPSSSGSKGKSLMIREFVGENPSRKAQVCGHAQQQSVPNFVLPSSSKANMMTPVNIVPYDPTNKPPPGFVSPVESTHMPMAPPTPRFISPVVSAPMPMARPGFVSPRYVPMATPGFVSRVVSTQMPMAPSGFVSPRYVPMAPPGFVSPVVSTTQMPMAPPGFGFVSPIVSTTHMPMAPPRYVPMAPPGFVNSPVESTQMPIAPPGFISPVVSTPMPMAPPGFVPMAPPGLVNSPVEFGQMPMAPSSSRSKGKSVMFHHEFAGDENPSKKAKVCEQQQQNVPSFVVEPMKQMLMLRTKGSSPNGVERKGFLYKCSPSEGMIIICACHGIYHTPAQFVMHAGAAAAQVENPLRSISVVGYVK